MRLNSGNQPCRIKIDGSEFDAEISDQSIGGLKVVGLSLIVMPYNKPVMVVFQDEEISGAVRSVTRDSTGQFELGIQRVEENEPLPEKSVLLLNCYIQHEGRDIVCIPIAIDPAEPNRMKIRLFNGHEFVVNRSLVIPHTRLEREGQLIDLAVRDWIARLYGIPGHSVLDFEFGAMNPVEA